MLTSKAINHYQVGGEEEFDPVSEECVLVTLPEF